MRNISYIYGLRRSIVRRFRRCCSTNMIDSSSLVSSTDVRKGFGSFHSDNVEDIVNLPPASFPLPACFDTICFPMKSYVTNNNLDDISYGDSCKFLFNLSPQFTFLNHGAFGAALIPLSDVATRFR